MTFRKPVLHSRLFGFKSRYTGFDSRIADWRATWLLIHTKRCRRDLNPHSDVLQTSDLANLSTASWSHRRDLNPHHVAYRATTLPLELRWQMDLPRFELEAPDCKSGMIPDFTTGPNALTQSRTGIPSINSRMFYLTNSQGKYFMRVTGFEPVC